ncbi:transcription elongation factor, mitochondrial isoform X2 [Camponotus floridanus]|uniref:transcription elongation factor, mitochondrial isoform X2 n=1 Tax=Camponotus floridanus TaxID=104421 RepID=UPI00059B5581|nr:transcription elongation factor, mitochondrial isoform X2 [Camponotus floridanus]
MWNMMLRRLFNKTFIKTQKTQIYKHWESGAITFKINSMCTDTMNLDSFSVEDEKKILQVINSKRMEDLLQYSITKKRAENLECHRANNGPYKSLEDLLQVKGINNNCLHKFYKSIIYGNKGTPKKITRGLILTPKANDQKDVNTVLGVYIGSDMISWSLLNRDCEVLQWNYKCFPQTKLKGNIHSLLQITLPIAEKLPKADRYVLQDIVGNIGHHKGQSAYQAYVQESVVNAIILSYLSTSNNSMEFITNNIFILRKRILPKIYGLVVDKENIATKYMMDKLLQESDRLKKTKERLPSVLINTELKNMYNTQTPIYQEQISWSLLIALAFLELVVHQRTDMILRSDI